MLADELRGPSPFIFSTTMPDTLSIPPDPPSQRFKELCAMIRHTTDPNELQQLHSEIIFELGFRLSLFGSYENPD